MEARFRSWLVAILVVIILVVATILIIVEIRVYGTGFPKKTLWDWLQLLIIPLALAVIALVFQLANTRTERQIAKERYEQDQQIAKERYEQDQQIALDKQHEDLLQVYLDRIAELLLKESLRTSPSEEVRNVARVRTITVLTQLNARRIGYVFTFLREAGLMSTPSKSDVVSLKGADLHAVKWGQVNLSDADLEEANLSGANLSFANLRAADLKRANLQDADIIGANLFGADLSRANLSNACLEEANLSGAALSEAALSEAALNGADLSRANLSNAFLYKANLNGANLNEAYLSGAYVTEEQLATVKSLKGATMPDGSIHP